MLSIPPLRDKLPVVKDAAGNMFVELPYAWQKWFSMIRENSDFANGLTVSGRPINLPSFTTAQKNALTNVSNGALIYDSTLGRPCFYAAGWVTL